MNITQAELEQWIAIASMIAYILSHVLAITGTPKWLPSWIVVVINIIATNYGKSKNADKKDDQ